MARPTLLAQATMAHSVKLNLRGQVVERRLTSGTLTFNHLVREHRAGAPGASVRLDLLRPLALSGLEVPVGKVLP